MVGMASCMGLGRALPRAARRRSGDYPSPRSHFDTAIARNAEGGIDAYFTMVRADYAAMLEARPARPTVRAAQLRGDAENADPRPSGGDSGDRGPPEAT